MSKKILLLIILFFTSKRLVAALESLEMQSSQEFVLISQQTIPGWYNMLNDIVNEFWPAQAPLPIYLLSLNNKDIANYLSAGFRRYGLCSDQIWAIVFGQGLLQSLRDKHDNSIEGLQDDLQYIIAHELGHAIDSLDCFAESSISFKAYILDLAQKGERLLAIVSGFLIFSYSPIASGACGLFFLGLDTFLGAQKKYLKSQSKEFFADSVMKKFLGEKFDANFFRELLLWLGSLKKREQKRRCHFNSQTCLGRCFERCKGFLHSCKKVCGFFTHPPIEQRILVLKNNV